MTQFKSEFLNIISSRGFIHQGTNLEGLDDLLAKETVTGYNGYDCTADSLHVGNLSTIMLLRWFQKCGHKPLIMLGGGTSYIGDPSGRDEVRRLMTPEIIQNNMNGIKKAFAKILDTESNASNKAEFVNNADWLLEIEYIPFLRDIGRHFSINRMLTFDSVRMRLDREQPLTFLEFNYMILQAYDFMRLSESHGVRLQTGGADQWGNIVNGIELTRKVKQTELFGLTVPLITKSTGEKMGKSVNGAVWINEDKVSPYDYWQFWRNTEDADVGRFLRIYTEVPVDEIERLEKLQGAEINEAKKILANEATKLCHGEEAMLQAAETARKTFEEGASGDNLPSITVSSSRLEAGVALLDAFGELNLSASRGETKRLIAQGGVRVNDETVSGENILLTDKDVKDGIIKLSAGRKKHGLIRVG